MKKSMIFVGLLAIGFANAQEGNVGINTDQPKATLDIQPNATNLAGTTNEGILAPKLSKDRIAKIATPVEGTLVYATDNVYAGTDNKVAKITEKGYYFYNGTEWVKAGANDKPQYWAEADNPNGTKNYYFVPFSNTGNEHVFNKEGYESFEFKNTTSDNFSKTNTKSAWWGFNDATYIVNKDHINNANNNNNEVRYQAQFRGLYTDNDATRKIRALIGGTNVAALGDNRNGFTIGTPLTSIDAGDITGFSTRGDVYTSGKVDALYGLTAFANNIGGGTVTSQFAADILSRNRLNGTSTNIYGTRSRVILEKGSTSDLAFAGHFQVAPTEAVINTAIQALRTDVSLNNSQVKHDVTHSIGFRNIIDLSNNSSINNYTASQMSINRVDATSTIKEYVGYGMTVANAVQNGKITNLYGIKLPDIEKGSDTNFAIHTGKGKVRFGELTGSGDRPVYVDADGILKVGIANTGATSLTGEENLQCNDANRGKMNFVKDVTIGSGTGDAFAVCLKGTDGKFYWRYLYGAGGVSNLEGNFGTGLQ